MIARRLLLGELQARLRRIGQGAPREPIQELVGADGHDLQGAAARRQTCSYGSWQIDFPEDRTAVVTMTEEYLYMESFVMGAALGTFDAVGMSVEAKTLFDADRFHGRHVLRW